MSVSGIGQSHAAQTESAHQQSSQKTQGGGSKANTAQGTAGQSHLEETHATQAANAAQNNAGHEQGNGQKNGQESNGSHVNLYA